MGMIEASDVVKALEDKTFIDQLIKEAVGDPDFMSGMGEDIAQEISDVLQDDPAFKRRLVESAVQDEGVRQTLVKQLLDDLT